MRAERLVDLIAGLGDGRSDRGDDAFAVRAEPDHLAHDCFENPAVRPAPAGVRRTDHAGLDVRQQHRRAIGGDHAEQDTRPVGRHRVGARPLGVRPWTDHADRVGRMDLVDRRQRGPGKHGRDGAAAVLGDRLFIIVGAVAHVEAGNHAFRDTAAPPEEAVRNAAERVGPDDLDVLSQGCA